MKMAVAQPILLLLLLIVLLPNFSVCQAEPRLQDSDGNRSLSDFGLQSPACVATLDTNSDQGQATVVEHQLSFSEANTLKLELGVGEESCQSNQLVDGHGTGLRPPTEEEWTQTLNSTNVVDTILLNASLQLPARVDHTGDPWFPPIGSQDGEGSCVDWACGYYMATYQEAKDHGWNLSEARWEGDAWNGQPSQAYQDKIMSPDFIYHLTNGGQNTGTAFENAIGVICDIGVCSWQKMPPNSTDMSSWPTEEAWMEAPFYRGGSSGFEYLRLDSDDGLTNLKNWLASDHLAVIGVDALQYLNLTVQDFWTLDNYASASLNHANTIVGYDDNVEYYEGGQLCRGAFKIANSWGVGGWEHVPDGCYWISYETMRQHVKYCYFYQDRTNYRPQLLCTFRLNCAERGECYVSVGMGNHIYPASWKSFSRFINGGDWPFCPNNIVFDVTEFKDTVSTIYGQQFFIKVYDDCFDNDTGTITLFSTGFATSKDPPVTLLNGGSVFADVLLPTEIRVPLDFVSIQKAVNSIVLGTNWNPDVTIQVEQGTYRENLVINKPVSLEGENMETTIIDGSVEGTDVVQVTTDNVNITGFTIENGGHSHSGVALCHVENCTVDGNNLIDNCYGVWLNLSANNRIYHNNFRNDEIPTCVEDSGSQNCLNAWDNGYVSGGNYFSDYKDTDAFRGVYQNETGGDETWDHPYVIDRNNRDNYPLLNPWTPIQAVVKATVTVAPYPLNLGFNNKAVTCQIRLPQGFEPSDIYTPSIELNETVPAYPPATPADNSGIADVTNQLTVMFNRTVVNGLILSGDIHLGNLTLAVEGQLYNRTLFEGSAAIMVRMPGDVNCDGKVNMNDVALAARTFGTSQRDARWNPLADENEDGHVDLRDIAIVAINFGKTYM